MSENYNSNDIVVNIRNIIYLNIINLILMNFMMKGNGGRGFGYC